MTIIHERKVKTLHSSWLLDDNTERMLTTTDSKPPPSDDGVCCEEEETGAIWMKRLAAVFEGESLLTYATLNVLASNPPGTYVVSTGNAITGSSSCGIVKTSRDFLQRCVDQGFWITSVNDEKRPRYDFHNIQHAFNAWQTHLMLSVPIFRHDRPYLDRHPESSLVDDALGFISLGWGSPCPSSPQMFVPLLQHLAEGIAPDFEDLTSSLLKDMTVYLPHLEDPEEAPLKSGLSCAASPLGLLTSSVRTSQITTPRSVSFSSMTPEDWSDMLLDDAGDHDFKLGACASKLSVPRLRNRAGDQQGHASIFPAFQSPELERAFCLFRNQEAFMKDAAVLFFALLGSVVQQIWDPYPRSAFVTASASTVTLFLWLGLILLYSSRYLKWRESLSVVGNIMMGILLCRLRWFSLVEMSSGTYWAAFRHLLTQPVVEAGLFYGIQIRLKTAVLWRNVPSAFFTSLLNYYIIRDGMPGANIAFWMLGSAAARALAIATAALAYRKIEAKARAEFLAHHSH
eukprot:jgi/Botrbrau1/2481/Bobra.0226s0038.1